MAGATVSWRSAFGSIAEVPAHTVDVTRPRGYRAPVTSDLVRELYAGPPDTFVERRKELAKQLRTSGDKSGAAEVAKLRRPSRAAWALNRVIAADPSALDALVEAGGKLEAVQRGESGGAAELRQLAGERRALISRLADGAENELGAEGSAVRERLQGTLEAASVDAAVADELRGGTLAKEVDPPSGFGPLGMAPALSLVPAAEEPEPEPGPEPEPDRRAELEDELVSLGEQLRPVEKHAEALQKELNRVLQQADRLRVRQKEIDAELEALD